MQASARGMLRKVVSIGASFALASTMVTAGATQALAAATSYEVPTQAKPLTQTDANGNSYKYVTCGLHAVTEIHCDLLGLNAVTSRVNTLPDWDHATSSSRTGIFGTAVNEQPDPYIWNYLYNLYATNNGKELSRDAILTSNGFPGPTNADTGTISADYGNVSATISMRPDVLYGTAYTAANESKSYDAQIATVNEGKSPTDADYYNPQQVSFAMNTMQQYLTSFYNLSRAADTVIKDSYDSSKGYYAKQGRYSDGPTVEVIADQMEDQTLGLQWYLLHQIAKGTTAKKTVALVTAYDEATDTFTLYQWNENLKETASTGNPQLYIASLQYACDNAIDVALSKGIITSDDIDSTKRTATLTSKQMTQLADAMGSDLKIIGRELDHSGDNPGMAALTAACPNTEMYLRIPQTAWEVNNYDSEGKTTSVTSSALVFFNDLFFLSFVYDNVIDPVDALAYTYRTFYHIADESIQDVVDITCANMSLPKSRTNLTVSSNYYNSIQRKMLDGAAYYAANKADVEKVSSFLTDYASYTDGVTGIYDADIQTSGSGTGISVKSVTVGGQALTEGTDYIAKSTSDGHAVVYGLGKYSGVAASPAYDVDGSSTVQPAVKGKSYTAGSGASKATYKVLTAATDTSTGTVQYTASKATSKTSVTVPATVAINGGTYKVVSTKASAFSKCTKAKSITVGKNVKKLNASTFKACKKLKKVTVKSKLLSKAASAKNSFKGCKSAKIAVKVNVGTKAVNKSYVKKYKKVFTAKNTKAKKMTVA